MMKTMRDDWGIVWHFWMTSDCIETAFSERRTSEVVFNFAYTLD